MTLLYDVARSPLPSSPAPVLKGGFNKWDTVVELPLHAANFEFPQSGDFGRWYKIELDLPDDIFEFVYVVYDRKSNVYDNNEGIDFSLSLVDAPTEEELVEGRERRYHELGKCDPCVTWRASRCNKVWQHVCEGVGEWIG